MSDVEPQWEACKVCGGDHWTKDHPDDALTHAISVLENYGDHHEWCARAGGSGEPCNCGLWDELERLRAWPRG